MIKSAVIISIQLCLVLLTVSCIHHAHYVEAVTAALCTAAEIYNMKLWLTRSNLLCYHVCLQHGIHCKQGLGVQSTKLGRILQGCLKGNAHAYRERSDSF